MVNSCTDYSQQYITNVLHDSEYVPAVAWTTLLSKYLPEKMFSKWKPEEIADGSAQVVLATAKVVFFDAHNNKHVARVVLDGGAQAHFISEKFATLLKLKRIKTNIPVVAINQMEATIRHKVMAKIASTQGEYNTRLSFLVVPSVSTPLPAQQINSKGLNIPRNLPLADPTFYKSSEIDALLGAELSYQSLCAKQIEIQNQNAVLQKTRFGWVVAGKITEDESSVRTISCNLSIKSIHHDISRFWELEEIPVTKFMSSSEAEVEQHFLDNVYRNETGRYVVRLPFNDKKDKLGNTYNIARRQFFALERRFARHPEIKLPYVNSMKEYINLRHMTKVRNPDTRDNYMSHHAVVKLDSTTTQYRPVFNASVTPEDEEDEYGQIGDHKKSERVTFNQTLMTGPTIQNDIFEILIRFRIHHFALIADIEKMYRQVLVHEDDRKYQQIFWREDPNEPLEVYQLNTLTFGTSCAPFLAIRTLHKLADDEKHNYPTAADVVKRDFYVDDLLTGSDTLENAGRLRDELNSLLKSGGFNLRKWASNDNRLIEPLSNDLANVHLFSDPEKAVKTLGIKWNSQLDELSYSLKAELSAQEKTTKRTILSNIAQLFDPIGLLGPIIVKAKLIMQALWKAKVDWDETLPLNIHTAWLDYKKQLPLLSNISFERCIVIPESVNRQLHGFCDASEVAYGACIYIRSTDKHGKCLTRLICSKSKVAPLNSKITIPRLELCAAVLLAKLYKTVSRVLPINFDNVYFWSDSTITLNWINTQPHILKTFVANRVSQIRTITNESQWHHVPTRDNPADAVSRGQSVSEFIDNFTWRNGPDWLNHPQDKWPIAPIQKLPLLEVRKITVLKTTLTDNSLLSRFSSITRLIRVIAHCLRFAINCSEKPKRLGHLSANEIQEAKIRIIKLIQNQAFAKEIHDLTKIQKVDNKSPLKTLNPFLDHNGILRVGGRIVNSHLAYDSKHPILLPKKSHVTDLIIKHEHEISLHAGIQNTLYQVRTQNPTPQHIMGNLPKNRLIQSRPFINTGIDYCGPFMIKEKKFRNRNKIKAYVAVYVCFATKAVHLEAVSDLTTDTFLGSLRRFFARRGKSKNIYTDNGTNFVGANNELKRLYEFIRSEEFNNSISNKLANETIAWHFIPPRSPHFGGLWESVAKSFKNHFLRRAGDALLTFEEFSTHVCEIEAILNSRPLTPVSTDPNDLIALTPAHFLINDSLMSIPDVDFSDTPANRLSIWEKMQKSRQHFWQRWHKEYLNELIRRSKWSSPKSDLITVGAMVLLQEENIPPLQWPLGRILEIHPGDDGVVRVVSVKTANGVFKRTVKKIAVLPIEQADCSTLDICN
ncbi:uncharacterized protein LOC108629432 [Ceratina calcarata]|uniref:Uncharacterized protein LOC108629432 n=1 Tax=Ceratina calcarata TaxID=156304 RepID=A0AAJ7NBW2_9HYME|nr:uncharacterized protein LOC108629432 [Ceratina calcarata]